MHEETRLFWQEDGRPMSYKETIWTLGLKPHAILHPLASPELPMTGKSPLRANCNLTLLVIPHNLQS